MFYASTANDNYYYVSDAARENPVGISFYKANIAKKTDTGFVKTNETAILPILQARLVAV